MFIHFSTKTVRNFLFCPRSRSGDNNKSIKSTKDGTKLEFSQWNCQWLFENKRCFNLYPFFTQGTLNDTQNNDNNNWISFHFEHFYNFGSNFGEIFCTTELLAASNLPIYKIDSTIKYDDKIMVYTCQHKIVAIQMG